MYLEFKLLSITAFNCFQWWSFSVNTEIREAWDLCVPLSPSDSAWLSDLEWRQQRGSLGWLGTPAGTLQLLGVLSMAPPEPQGEVTASEACRSRSQVHGWHESRFTAQPTEGSVGSGVDIWFHNEMNLLGSDWSFSRGSEFTLPKQSFGQNNNNKDPALIWKLTFCC